MSDARPLTSGAQIIEGLALSPDGAWLAYDTYLNGNQDIYKLPLVGVRRCSSRAIGGTTSEPA